MVIALSARPYSTWLGSALSVRLWRCRLHCDCGSPWQKSNESEERTWEPLSSFQFEHGTTQLVVEYEENRTGLTRTTEPVTITYTGDRGTVVQEPDGFRVYTALAGETVKSVANTLGVSVQNLLEQNSLRYPYRFSAKFKLRDGDHLRMPIPV